jgi:hypothetical protein
MGEPDDPRKFHFYLNAVRELGHALTGDARQVVTARPLRESLYRIMGTFAIGRGALLLHDDETGRVAPVVAKGLRPNRAMTLTLGAAETATLATSAHPFHVNFPRAGLEPLAERLRPALERASLQWIAPLGTGHACCGLLLLGPRLSGEPLTSLELEVLEQMATIFALHLDADRTQRKLAGQVRQQQQVNQQLRQIYLDTVRTLAGVIDGPEQGGGPGHSARVAALAAEMAARLGLSVQRRQRLYLAGLLHDIGKQIIEREILNKQGPLAPAERERLEAYPVIGYELIGHLRFPWGDVAEIIRHHQERLDGRGYPDRLAGDQISLEAKILMMAESFDAMTHDRPWRPRLAFERVVAQIQQNLGLQFEPRVAQALCDAVQAGLAGEVTESADFVPHLENAFDPALIRNLLSELRRQLASGAGAGGPATVIEAIKGGAGGAGESGTGDQ